MPNLYIENRDRWEQLSEVDYLGAFANAWLAFNAWYRNAFNEHRDRVVINAIKNEPNVVRNGLVPMLSSDSEEAEQLRANIGLLHHRIENYHLHSGKNEPKERITLTNVYVRDNNLDFKTQAYSGITYEVDRQGGQVECQVINRAGGQIFHFVQPRYDYAELEANPDLSNNLNQAQRGRILSLHRAVCPKCVANLADSDQAPIECGAFEFTCTPEDLFAGVVEVIYLMRCTFFHGELVPSREAGACYEPAYHLVRRFLQAVT